MNIIAHNRKYAHATLTAPASKSHLQRALAIATLCEGTSEILHFYPSKDALAALSMIQHIGANTYFEGDSLFIKGVQTPSITNITLHCGEAGLSTRMFSPIAASLFQEALMIGEGSLLQRPMHMVADALTQLGCEVSTQQGFLPMKLRGKIHPTTLTIDGSESSQLLTGLLIALPLLGGDSIIHVQNLNSIPYIQMTLEVLERFGIHISHENFEIFYISGNQKVKATKFIAEGDWSGAAFHLVAGAISGNVTVKGLNPSSCQADRAIMTALSQCGAGIEVKENTIYVEKKSLLPFHFDATHCPDLFPPLAVLAACCDGVSSITGTNRLMHKESNRALAIQQEFQILGIEVILTENTMEIVGGKSIQGGNVWSHHDHRIAMALTILATVAENNIQIQDMHAIQKSYPTFLEDFNNMLQ